MHYLYCLGITASTCGDIDSLEWTGDTYRRAVIVKDIFREDGMACYWKIHVEDNWKSGG
jgi:hypothetical protein